MRALWKICALLNKYLICGKMGVSQILSSTALETTTFSATGFQNVVTEIDFHAIAGVESV